MSKINRRYIDKHWLVFVIRGCLAGLFGMLMIFNCLQDTMAISLPVGVYLLSIGAIDAVSAIYSSNKRHGWITALLDSVIDVVAALVLLFVGRDSLVANVLILAIYTLASGLVDVFHGFVSTVDPTDRFIRILSGVVGCVMGVVILNTGDFDVVEFYRFFGIYVLLVGVTSLIYGVHNRAQIVEARETMREIAQEREQEQKSEEKKEHRHERKSEHKPEQIIERKPEHKTEEKPKKEDEKK